MKITVLGSGTAVPHPKRSSPGFWIDTSKATVLLDCGPSVLMRMAQENLDWANLDAVWISHFHLDHLGGLPGFLFGTRNAPEMQARSKPLHIFGPKGLFEILEKFDSANNYKLFKQPCPLNVIEVEPLSKFEIVKGIEAVALSTPHTDESLALHLREAEAGSTFVYTADTGFTESIASFAHKADLLLVECSFFREKKVEIHLELAEAMHIVRRCRPKRAMFTHFYAEWDTVNFDDEVAAFSPGCQVIQAADGMTIEI